MAVTAAWAASAHSKQGGPGADWRSRHNNVNAPSREQCDTGVGALFLAPSPSALVPRVRAFGAGLFLQHLQALERSLLSRSAPRMVHQIPCLRRHSSSGVGSHGACAGVGSCPR